MLVFVTLVSVFSISAEAVKIKVEDRKYGYMVPVNNKGTKVLSSVNLYGDYDYLNFFIHSGFSGDVYFFYEIYSDEKLTKPVGSGYTVCSYGDYNMSEKIALKGTYKSKTYYAVTYAGMFSSSKKTLTVDENSFCQFKIVVDRSPSYDDKKVTLKSVSNTAKGPEIKWTKISGTSEYYIYRRSIDSTKYKKVGSVSGKKSSFVDTSVKKKDGNYIYTVKGISKKNVASKYHYAGITCLYAEMPTISSVSVVADNEISIKWKETSSKAKYYLYRKEVGGSWKRIADTYNNYYSDKKVKNGKEYMYRVKAVISSDYGKAKSAYYVADKKTVEFLQAPIMNELEITETGIGLSWCSVEGACGYSVLRKTLGSDEDWTILGRVSGEQNSYMDETASLVDGAYVYTVRSEGDGFSGSYSSGKEYFTLAQPEFTVDADEDGVHVKWDKVPYATSYRVLEQGVDGNWIIKGKTKKSYYDFKPSSYYNKKISVCAVRSGKVSTHNTDVGAVQFFPEITPTIKEIDTYTKFEWGYTYADKYRVYSKLKDAPDTDYQLIYEGTARNFINENPEEDVAYTYQVRGVYSDIEQYNNIVSKTHTRYSQEKCIESFKVTKEIEVFNSRYKSSDKVTEYYIFDVDKTDAFKKATTNIYNFGMDAEETGGWERMGNVYRIDAEDVVNIIEPLRFSCVVSNSKGSTAIGANPVYVNEEVCEAPVVTLTPTSKGLKLTWDAVDGAVEYDVSVYFSKRDDYKKTFKADGSKTYTVNFNDISYDYNIYLYVSAVHENGNVTRRAIDDYALYPKPKLIKAGVKNDEIKVIWDGEEYDNYQYAVLRKAEGESKWTCVSKEYYDSRSCIMMNGTEYIGMSYTDKKAKKGVKYTYTVRLYNPTTKEYVSYYNTKGISAKR